MEKSGEKSDGDSDYSDAIAQQVTNIYSLIQRVNYITILCMLLQIIFCFEIPYRCVGWQWKFGNWPLHGK
jgi:hypothetical protein